MDDFFGGENSAANYQPLNLHLFSPQNFLKWKLRILQLI